jgi:prepilin-type processing-associated H-X9-DG protein
MNSPKSINGFTFLELLMVFAVISILTLMLLPALQKMKAKGRQATCVGNQRQLAIAALLYANDSLDELPVTLAYLKSGEYLPPLSPCNHNSNLFEKNAYAQSAMADFYNSDFRLTQCPEVEGSMFDATPTYSYALNIYITGMRLDLIESAATTVMMADSHFAGVSSTEEVAFRHGDNVAIAAYVDGHIELFQDIIPPSKFTPQKDDDEDFEE